MLTADQAHPLSGADSAAGVRRRRAAGGRVRRATAILRTVVRFLRSTPARLTAAPTQGLFPAQKEVAQCAA